MGKSLWQSEKKICSINLMVLAVIYMFICPPDFFFSIACHHLFFYFNVNMRGGFYDAVATFTSQCLFVSKNCSEVTAEGELGGWGG